MCGMYGGLVLEPNNGNYTNAPYTFFTAILGSLQYNFSLLYCLQFSWSHCNLSVEKEMHLTNSRPHKNFQ